MATEQITPQELAGIAYDARLVASLDDWLELPGGELNPFEAGTRRALLWTSHYLEARLELDPPTPPTPPAPIAPDLVAA